MVLKKNRTVCKNNNLDTDLTPDTKINSRWIIDLNVKCQTTNLLEENPYDLGFGDEFLNTTSME